MENQTKTIYEGVGYHDIFWEDALLKFLTDAWKPYTFSAEFVDKKNTYKIKVHNHPYTDTQKLTFEGLSFFIQLSVKAWCDGYKSGESEAEKQHAEEAAGADL